MYKVLAYAYQKCPGLVVSSRYPEFAFRVLLKKF